MISSSAGDYSSAPYIGIVNPSNILDSSNGYKWQVLACDNVGACSSWKKYDLSAPNFKTDTILPSAPGQLTLSQRRSSSITLNFGATSTESNFREYVIYYKAGPGVTENDSKHEAFLARRENDKV